MILGDRPIGHAIKQWRTNMGMTKTEAANAAGIGLPMWSRIEEGQTAKPQWDTIVKMFQAMGAVVNIAVGARARSWFDEQLPATPTAEPLPHHHTPLPWPQGTKPGNRVHGDA